MSEPTRSEPTPRPPTTWDPTLWDPTAVPAATVIVVRDAAVSTATDSLTTDSPATDSPGSGIEVLMLRRDSELTFAGGAWVFPGGRIDPADLDAAPDTESAARAAAVREAAEEAAIRLDPASLRRWSHWTPPSDSPRRRFSTAFFVAPLPDGAGEVRVDDGEIREFRWQRPADVLTARDDGEVVLTPPTYITLCQLAVHAAVPSVLDAAEGVGVHRPVEHFATRLATTSPDPDVFVVMYHGDAGYETGDATLPGGRHRLHMGATWRYERDP